MWSKLVCDDCISLCVLSWAYISANYLIIDQPNRKYLTCAQKVTASLFIARTGTELKGMTKKPLLSSPESVRQSDGWGCKEFLTCVSIAAHVIAI